MGEENPQVLVAKSQNRQKLTVWCEFTATRVIVPIIMKETMNGERYLFDDEVWPFVNDQDNLIFMQDGAPAHYAAVVREWLDEHFPGRWIGRRGPHAWPPRSPDLTPCDFFLWGWVKTQVYSVQTTTLNELEDRIINVLCNIPQQFLMNAIHAIPDRRRKLSKNAGAYVEF